MRGHESGEIPEECEMSIRPAWGVEVPELTARMARPATRLGLGVDDGGGRFGMPARSHADHGSEQVGDVGEDPVLLHRACMP